MAAYNKVRKFIVKRWVLLIFIFTILIFTFDMGAHLTRQQYLSYGFSHKAISPNINQDPAMPDANEDDHHIVGKLSEYALKFFTNNVQRAKGQIMPSNANATRLASTTTKFMQFPNRTTIKSYETTASTNIQSTAQAVTTPRTPGIDSMDRDLSLPPEVPIRPNSKEPILEYSQQRDYKPLITQDEICGNKTIGQVGLENFDYENDVFLIMVVKSACAYAVRRNALRQSWGNIEWAKRELKVNIRLVFLLGACQNADLQAKVLNENKNHHDILQWDFFDSFRNLTLKECLFLQWFSKRCSHVPYIFKGDDDIFANTKNLVKYLKDARPEARRDLFVGSVLRGSPRILDPTWKYYVSYNLYPDKIYPPYVSGGGFLMSGDLAQRLFQATLLTRIIPIDDAFVGILLKKVGVSPQNDKGFKSWGIKNLNVCRLSKIMTYHKLDPFALVNQWNALQELDPNTCGRDTDDVFRSNMKKR